MRRAGEKTGSNGYIWSVSTPTLRYYEYHHSRGHEVVEALLGEDFQGVLGSDFYAAYNIHQGLHQRCWVHFLRDGHELKEQYADDATVQQWFTQVKALYERARAYGGPIPTCHRPSRRPLARSSSMPSSRSCGSCVRPMPTRLRPCRPCVSESNASYPNCSSLWRDPRYPRTTIWRSAVCARW